MLALIALTGCSWISKPTHEANLAAWMFSVEDVDADFESCGTDTVVIDGQFGDALPEGTQVELTVDVDGTTTQATAQSTAGGVIQWTLPSLPPVAQGEQTLTLSIVGDGFEHTVTRIVSFDAPPTTYADADMDGYGDGTTADQVCDTTGRVEDSTDCDDGEQDVNPGADELCNGIDDDCDEAVDDADDDVTDASLGFPDADGDGYGEGQVALAYCDPTGTVSVGDDCDDTDGTVNPGATETCNGIDDDCDTLVDDDDDDVEVPAEWYQDADGDGVGSAALDVCTGGVAEPGDCDDGNNAVFPGAGERCTTNGVDDDCDGAIDGDDDDLTDGTANYPDGDGDGYGDDASLQLACEALSGLIQVGGDCDDTDATINPNASEVCNDVDDDCDGLVDAEDDSIVGTEAAYVDADGDGHGAGAEVQICPGDDGYAATDDDCNDNNDAISPTTPEACNNIDDDCSGIVDDVQSGDAGSHDVWPDTDGDGFGDKLATVDTVCDILPGFVEIGTDCDDDDDERFPGNPEICDGKDNDCDQNGDDALVGVQAGGVGYTDLSALFTAVAATEVTVCGPAAWPLNAPDLPLTIMAGNGIAQIQGRIVRTTPLTVTGVDLAPTTANVDGGVLHATTTDVSLADLTIDCGLVAQDDGGAIFQDGGTLELAGVTVTNCEANRGGGLHLANTVLDVTGPTVISASDATSGGGVYAQGSTIQLTGAGTLTIDQCTAVDGAGAYLVEPQGQTPAIVLTDNEASGNGAMVIESSTAHTAAGLNFTGNRGNPIAGLHYDGEGLDLSDADFSDNAGISLQLAEATIPHQVAGSFTDNTGTAVVTEGDVDIHDSDFTGNTSSQGPAGVHGQGQASVSLETVTFANNVNNSAAPGGAVGLGSSSLQHSLEGVSFTNNQASLQSSAGGALAIVGGSVQITDCEFAANQTPYTGGAVALLDVGDVTITSSSFTGNDTTVVDPDAPGGGGLYIRPDVGSAITLDGLTVSDNTALGAVGGGISIDNAAGASVVFSGATTTIDLNNAASGGAMYAKGGGIQIDGAVDVDHNTSPVRGAVTLTTNGNNTCAPSIGGANGSLRIFENNQTLSGTFTPTGHGLTLRNCELEVGHAGFYANGPINNRHNVLVQGGSLTMDTGEVAGGLGFEMTLGLAGVYGPLSCTACTIHGFDQIVEECNPVVEVDGSGFTRPYNNTSEVRTIDCRYIVPGTYTCTL